MLTNCTPALRNIGFFLGGLAYNIYIYYTVYIPYPVGCELLLQASYTPNISKPIMNGGTLAQSQFNSLLSFLEPL